VGVGITRY